VSNKYVARRHHPGTPATTLATLTLAANQAVCVWGRRCVKECECGTNGRNKGDPPQVRTTVRVENVMERCGVVCVWCVGNVCCVGM